MIRHHSFNLNKVILTNEILKSYIIKFWTEVFKQLVIGSKDTHLMIICKVKYSEGGNYKTMGPLRRVEFSDMDLFVVYLTERLSILIDSYESQAIDSLIFTYIVKKGKITSKDRLLLKDTNSNRDLTFHEFNKIKLPISMNPNDYGILLSKSVVDGFNRYITTLNKKVFQIDQTLDLLVNYVTNLGGSELKWTDTVVNDDGTFKREIGKSTLYFLDGVNILQKLELSAKPFKKGRSGQKSNK